MEEVEQTHALFARTVQRVQRVVYAFIVIVLVLVLASISGRQIPVQDRVAETYLHYVGAHGLPLFSMPTRGK